MRSDVEDAGVDGIEKIQALHKILYARTADADEIQLGESFVRTAINEVRLGQLTPWERYAQALMLANEFLFVD